MIVWGVGLNVFTTLFVRQRNLCLDAGWDCRFAGSLALADLDILVTVLDNLADVVPDSAIQDLIVLPGLSVGRSHDLAEENSAPFE